MNDGFFSKLPTQLLALVSLCSFYGILILYSAGNNEIYPWAFKQFLYFVIFFPIMILVSNINLRIVYNYTYTFYFMVLILLILVELVGYKAMGAKRWLGIGGLRIQPSELAKISTVMCIAKYFYQISYDQVKKISYLVIPATVCLIPAALIMKQPDLGTAMIILIVSAMVFYIAGVRKILFASIIIVVIVMSPIVWSKMHDYQKRRVEVFLNPEKDPLGSGYNIIQSKIAIGSGGFFGNGLGKGTQSHLSFLPEHQTDFIFACLAEDLGFLGVLVLMIIYIAIIIQSMSISANSRNIYTKLLSAGICGIFFTHIAVNIGMVSGLLPVVGIPLPLISYGGTMMGSFMIGFGIIMNVHKNKYTNL